MSLLLAAVAVLTFAAAGWVRDGALEWGATHPTRFVALVRSIGGAAPGGGVGGAAAMRATLERLLPTRGEPELRRVLAMLCYLEGNYRATLEHFGEAPPATVEGWLVLGRAHAALRDFDAAESCIAAALALDPAIPQARADTAVAHLAGALGMPVWILLPASADWRWGELGAEATPWYPTARLFWQRHPGDWREALACVAAELGNIVEPAAVRLPGLFSAEECAALLAAAAPEAMRRAQLSDGTPKGTVDASVFSADWAAVEPPAWAAERIVAACCAANEILGAEICGRLEFGRIIRYREGDHFDWHGDRIASDGDRGRRLSITVQLSDPADYEGGDLLLLPPAAPPGAALVASRARGDAVVFRSEVLHRVAPVTRGERVSLVLWLH